MKYPTARDDRAAYDADRPFVMIGAGIVIGALIVVGIIVWAVINRVS